MNNETERREKIEKELREKIEKELHDKPNPKPDSAARIIKWMVGLATAVVAAAIIGAFGFLWAVNAINSATQERLKTIDTRLDKLDGVPQTETSLDSEVKTNSSEIAVLRNEATTLLGYNQKHEGDTTHATNEINQLRTQSTSYGQSIQRLDLGATTATNEINTLRRQEEDTCTLLALMRERIATLEAKAGVAEKQAAK